LSGTLLLLFAAMSDGSYIIVGESVEKPWHLAPGCNQAACIVVCSWQFQHIGLALTSTSYCLAACMLPLRQRTCLMHLNPSSDTYVSH
jgi:hypothetical protein